jgi:hypothetical protein
MNIPTNRSFYHVRHDLQPKLTEELLILLWDKAPCHLEAIQQSATNRGYQLANRSPEQLLASLGNLRIIGRRDHGEICLTDLGKSIARTAKYNQSLLPELIHFTYYTAYDASNPSSRFSWAYRLICDYLWRNQRLLISVHNLVTLVQEQAQQVFHDYGISFSQNSVAGVINWLEALNPPCIAQPASGRREFTLRLLCPSELVLLALEYASAQEPNPLASQLRLTNENRELIARLCLIEKGELDDLLQIAADAYGLTLRHTERGSWISLLGDRSPLPLDSWLAFSHNGSMP